MSDYIYGSSLRAAKSKANYLFEGDFRRRPNQNLSGASRSLARGELLQQAAEQRQNREDIRKREQSSIKIQSVWRGYRCRNFLRMQMRATFDNIIGNIRSQDEPRKLSENELEILTREFILYFHSKADQHRFDALIDLILKNEEAVIKWKEKEPKAWLHKMIKLLTMNLKPLEENCSSSNCKYLRFLVIFTRSRKMLDESQCPLVWETLIKHRVYTILRHLVESNNRRVSENNLSSENDLSRILIELVTSSLDNENPVSKDGSTPSIYLFFREFLRGPLDPTLENLYLPKLLKLAPKKLRSKYILKAFRDYTRSSPESFRVTNNSNQIQDCANTTWLCYSFVRTIYSQLDKLEDNEKVEYINILSDLIAPAYYITNLSLMQAANNADADQDEEGPDELTVSLKDNPLNLYHPDINSVITRLVNIVNDVSHIDQLKPIVFSKEMQSQVQRAIIKICNLMLAHEPLAIFNCRLLYTVAFSREFSRSLWKSITSLTSPTLYGPGTSIYMELARGHNISHESWNLVLPQLRLFCSLYSYLLPTLDDVEFYTDDGNSILMDNSNNHSHLDGQGKMNSKNNQNHGTFFIDKELVSISAVLRDICVGFIEILYQDNRHAYHPASTKFDSKFQDESNRLLSFEMKICFKALVRLICQLHARNARKQFCPDDHWICPSVAIPANKAIDFQLVSSQQGRLLSQMTKDDSHNERMSTTPSEIKTVLILQEIPFVISFHARVQILHQLLRKEKLIHQSEGYHFELPGTAIVVQIRRNYIYEDAFEKLSFDNEPNMKLPLKVSLINAVGADEAGIDGGGLSKEFICELLKAGFDPMRGFFKSTTDHRLYPNPSANVLFATLPEGYEIHYEFLGRMLGKAIFDKIMVELPLASFFLAKLLARRHSSDVDLHNLASLDPMLYKNLVYLKNYKGDVADLNLDFTISNNELGEHEVVELKPGGSKIPVTKENKIEYVHLVADYRLNKQIRAQCAAFKRGLAQLIDLDWLRMFDSRELQILISGAPTVIDVEDWRRNTQYTNGYSEDCEVIKTFWRVTSQFDENEKRQLLKFATSCSLPPLLGFKDLVPQFTIAPADEARLPTASTCMNLLKLPKCEDDRKMRSKLIYAIESNSGFELS